MSKPLDGILVVSLEQAVAAPFLTSRLADAGARVIKLERAGSGDFARGYDDYVHGLSGFFLWLNRGKQSLAIDIKEPGDRALLERMLARADVWVQNLAPGATERAGLGSAALRERFPRLITVDISGYGDAGPPYDTMKAYDLLVQAESGLASVTGSASEPGRVGVSICDLTTGLNGVAAVMQALYGRERTGRGAGIGLSLFGSLADWMTAPILAYEHAGEIWPRMALRHPVLVPYGAYRTADDHLTLVACQNEREWRRFCEHVLRDAGYADDPEARSNVERVRNRERVDARIDAVTSTITRDELHARLRAGDIAFGAVNAVPDLLDHPAMRRIEVDTPAGRVAMPAPGVSFSDDDSTYRPVPALDEHGAAIRREFAE